MIVFADSSAVVKLYVDEEHHRAVRAVTSPFAISVLAQVEVPAALWRKHRAGELAAEDARAIEAAFAADVVGVQLPYPRFQLVEPTPAVVGLAARSVSRHPLRACDAVQLASAMALRDVAGDRVAFAALDRQLRDAANAEGFDLLI